MEQRRRMQETVEEVLLRVQQAPQLGEALVRQVIVLRFLQAGGFDIWNPTEVVPEETNIGGRRPDFLVRVGEAFALEIKGMAVTLGASEIAQAVSYALNEGVRWAILTNGRVWVLLDEHKNGKPHEREVLRLEMTFTQPQHLADDLDLLLNAVVWRAGQFEEALSELKARLGQRQQAQKVMAEKMPLVLRFQEENDIRTFSAALKLFAELGKITELEREILSGQVVVPSPEPLPEAAVPSEIEFRGKMKTARAHVIYRPEAGTWTLQPGSTFLDRPSVWPSLEAEIQNFLDTGILVRQEGLLRLTAPLPCASPSGAGNYVLRKAVNGWDFWKDTQGQSAQHYRKK